jgi:hypothetical protein
MISIKTLSLTLLLALALPLAGASLAHAQDGSPTPAAQRRRSGRR